MVSLLSYRTDVHTGQAEQRSIIQEMLLHRLQDLLLSSIKVVHYVNIQSCLKISNLACE